MTKKATEGFVDEVFAAMAAAIQKDGRFTFPGFGTFSVRERKARTGRNPQTGEPMTIAASKTVAFKPATAFKDDLGA
jgi:DNA-binding protein HU-beta